MLALWGLDHQQLGIKGGKSLDWRIPRDLGLWPLCSGVMFQPVFLPWRTVIVLRSVAVSIQCLICLQALAEPLCNQSSSQTKMPNSRVANSSPWVFCKKSRTDLTRGSALSAARCSSSKERSIFLVIGTQ